MKIQNFPDIDLPTVTVTAALPGASPAQLETEVARKIENSIATVQGVKHIYTDGAGRHRDDHGRVPAREADAGGGRRRARRGVARALRPARRPARPGHHEDGARRHADPDLHRRVAAAWTTRRCPGSSTTRSRKTLLSVPGVGAVSRVGGVDARGARRARPGAAAGAQRDRGRDLAPAAPDPAGGVGRPHRRRRRRAVGAHDRDRAVGRRAGAHGDRADRRPAHPPRPGRDASATPSAEQRSAALLNGKPVVGFEIVRSARRRRGRRRRRRARRAREAEGRAPGHHDHRGVQLRRPGAARTTTAR